ncbi:hypothetical protein PS896_05528 [Pseudomonas fluorescens]|jgi:hypothetical protein|uniref:Uncharacterized protein n=1 Tax=Pseudomonas fluorescens TaxID=294 RepID=A0A5E7PUY6_PSEFL|nr:hypothetical protein [Pseudomonas fluorescens]VVP53612.1 hypothetical protein PS896_05528 [Pseudomonas fluorescens]
MVLLCLDHDPEVLLIPGIHLWGVVVLDSSESRVLRAIAPVALLWEQGN